MSAFTPGQCVILACTGTSGRVALPTSAGNQIEVSNDGSVTIFVTLGTSTVTATVPNSTTGGYAVLAGQSKLISVAGQTHIAGITGGTAATLYTTVGNGD